MDVRGKLIELISDFVIHVPHEEGQTWEEACADHLLANGVTVQECIGFDGKWIVKGQEVFCSNCNKESGYNAWGASAFSDYCPNCGKKMMTQPPKAESSWKA